EGSVDWSGAPGHYGSVGRCLADLVWSGPCLAECRAEAVVHVVVVGVDEVDVAGLVDADVDELVSVSDCGVRIDVDWIVSEAEPSVDGDCDPDGVGAEALAGDFAGVGE